MSRAADPRTSSMRFQVTSLCSDRIPGVRWPLQRVLRETLAEATKILEGFEFDVAAPLRHLRRTRPPTRPEGREDV